MHTLKMNVLALKIRLQLNFIRFAGAFVGVVKFLYKLYLDVLLQHIVTKFDSTST